MKILGSIFLVLVLLGVGSFVWASGKANDLLSRTIDVHTVDFPVPYPVDPEEVAELGLSPEQADSAAFARARQRGQHLLTSRYACTECHGEDFGGGLMVDDGMIGTILGPNITSGSGGRVASYTPADWDRIVRHGVLPDGRPAAMPSQDFERMSDQELSDLIVVIRSAPPVDAEVASPSLGPLGTFLVATGGIPLSADLLDDHLGAHDVSPPLAEANAEFGAHLASVCTGCHGPDLSGGNVPGGDPSWPPATNLTPLVGGLGDWTYEQFASVMREGERADGSPLLQPMAGVIAFTANMTETEMRALWAYLRSIPPTATAD
jgi:mono/diheme cytochrome c family protein